MEKKIIIGCVADDFTGASDAASFLLSKGMKTILFNGIPEGKAVECDAVVIALKSRTQEIESAIADTRKAFTWLEEQGTEHYYFKYCSTFDSTSEGNIGPVVDMLLETFHEKYTILSPALPVNGRTVESGFLYVNGVLLSESYMKDHPLTPMHESEIAKLIEMQGKYQALNIDYALLGKSKEEILNKVESFGRDKEHFYIVPDYMNDENGEKAAEVFGDNRVLTGGSGILAPLAEKYMSTRMVDGTEKITSKIGGRGIVLSGSCSKMTLEQVDDFQKKGYVSYKIDPIELLCGRENFCRIWDVIKNEEKDVLIYSSDNAENILKVQENGKEKIAQLLEQLMADLAEKAIETGYKRIVVAGGETSSAVVKRLGYNSFEIGESIAPGVPIMMPITRKDLRIILKSGNFGQVDFFDKSVRIMQG